MNANSTSTTNKENKENEEKEENSLHINRNNHNNAKTQNNIRSILNRLNRPPKAVITAGMPYANGPLHIGHLAGAHVPADIYARWMRLLIGKDNVLFVCGTDDHGSNSEVAAKKQNISSAQFIEKIHSEQVKTMNAYHISLDVYSGTSNPKHLSDHTMLCQDFLRNLHKNKLLDKKETMQWFDQSLEVFLPDRFVVGTCPNCNYNQAYSNDCESCGANYKASQLIRPISTVSESKPVLKATSHWFLNMWKTSDQVITWLNSKKRSWHKSILNEVMGTILPALSFSKTFEDKYKLIKSKLPSHNSRYAPGKQIVATFNNLDNFQVALNQFKLADIDIKIQDEWAYRSITRDVKWGIEVPNEIDSSMQGKTLYVWPESLIAPISFTKQALIKKGLDASQYKDYWRDKNAKRYQFLGVDNIFFYVLMQSSMWQGQQDDPLQEIKDGEIQMTDIFSSYHLQINGEKMSKSSGNYYSADQLLSQYKFTSDQIRYFLAILSLREKASNFDFKNLELRNKFLKGPLNAAFEKPLAAAHSKFNGYIPQGEITEKVKKESIKIVQTYTKFMERGEFPKAIYAVENYARIINSLFAQFKPHDDRYPQQERQDALYSSFYILKNLLIMLSPIVPETMEKLRVALNLNSDVYSIDQLDIPIAYNHKLNKMPSFFP